MRTTTLPAEAGPPLRAVLDTNAVLDWLVFGQPDALAFGSAIQRRRLTWLATPRMLAELRAVLSRPLLPRWEAARELALTIDMTGLVASCADPVTAGPRLVCRDADDQMFIDLACEHSPALLLTRDRALLALRRRASTVGVDIMTPAWWQRRLDSPP